MERKRICACEGQTLDRLLQPAVMAALAEEPLHGYALIEKLKASPLMKGNPPDPSGVYRLLKTLEEQGLVAHGRSPSKEGPDKRPYRLTASGKKCIHKWIDTLDEYQKGISGLIATMRKAGKSCQTSRKSCCVGAGQR